MRADFWKFWTGQTVFGIALYFRLFSPLGHAERYLEKPAEAAAT